MKYERYAAVYEADDLSVFEFISEGRNGKIKKRIVFAKTEMRGVYNIAFGNISANNTLDDETINDNGDRNKVLATVAQAVDRYTRRYPRRWIYFSGSTYARTRLYRMAISLNLDELTKIFEIYAEVNGQEEFVPFHKNMVIEGFLVRRRIWAIS